MATLKNGTSGSDTLTSTSIGDTLSGGGGNDTYIVAHADVVIQDFYYGDTDTVRTSYLDSAGVYSLRAFYGIENVVYTGTAAARLQGNSLSNTITGAGLNDTLEGGAGADSLNGMAGDDLISGGTGDDTLDGGANTLAGDTLIGGSGNDTYIVNSAADQTLESVNSGFDTIQSAGIVKNLSLSKYVNFEGLRYTGTTAATLTGNKAGNNITSTSTTTDMLYGLAGDDTLDGGTGADSLYGGTGDDTYLVDTADKVFENAGEGIDTLKGAITSLNTTTTGANFATTVENLTYTGTSNATLTGNNLDNVMVGGSGSNTIYAFNGNDTIDGGAGNDSISGGNGNDYLTGGDGKDTLAGGAGDDHYIVADALETITEGADSVGGANDWIHSSINIKLGDAQYANVNNLLLTGNSWIGEGSAGNNVIIGNDNENYLAGMGGDDVIAGSGYEMTGYSNSSTGTVVSGTVAVASTIYLGSNSGGAADVLDGGAGNDTLIGSATSNYAGSTSEALLGGLGNDTYIIRSTASTVSDSGGTDTVISLLNGTLSLEEYAGIENAKLADSSMLLAELSALSSRLAAAGVSATVGSSGNYYGYGDAGLIGNELANTLTGNSANNLLDGGSGNDTLYGGAGNDTLIGGDGTDSLVGGDGNDVYEIGTGDVIVETATGGNRDAIRSSSITSLGTAYANIEGLYYTGTNSVKMDGLDARGDLLAGGSGNDTITGLGGNDMLSGEVGNDSISGGAGADSLSGGDGLDTLDGGTGTDMLTGGAGNDILRGGDDVDSLSGNDGADTVDGGAGDDSIQGNNGNDSLTGGAGNDTLLGDRDSNYWSSDSPIGNDTLDGGSGNDNLYGNDGSDSLTGGEGNDTLIGDWDNTYGTGGSPLGNDTLDGGSGNDSLYGNNGDDVLNASGQGLATDYWSISGDKLSGGDGNDTFRFSEAYGSTSGYLATGHLVNDFTSGSDKLHISKTLVGNGDVTLTSATATAGTSTVAPTSKFSKTAELVFFSGDTGIDLSYGYGYGSINTYLNASSFATAIGSANASFAVGDKRILVVNDGEDSAILQFVSAGADAVVSGAELKLIGVISGDASLAATDFQLF